MRTAKKYLKKSRLPNMKMVLWKIEEKKTEKVIFISFLELDTQKETWILYCTHINCILVSRMSKNTFEFIQENVALFIGCEAWNIEFSS